VDAAFLSAESALVGNEGVPNGDRAPGGSPNIGGVAPNFSFPCKALILEPLALLTCFRPPLPAVADEVTRPLVALCGDPLLAGVPHGSAFCLFKDCVAGDSVNVAAPNFFPTVFTALELGPSPFGDDFVAVEVPRAPTLPTRPDFTASFPAPASFATVFPLAFCSNALLSCWNGDNVFASVLSGDSFWMVTKGFAVPTVAARRRSDPPLAFVGLSKLPSEVFLFNRAIRSLTLLMVRTATNALKAAAD